MSFGCELRHNPDGLELVKSVNSYKCCRDCVRSKVESFNLDDLYIPEDEKAQVSAIAQGYFQLAKSYVIDQNKVDQVARRIRSRGC